MEIANELDTVEESACWWLVVRCWLQGKEVAFPSFNNQQPTTNHQQKGAFPGSVEMRLCKGE
jgi:hypothetical protein